MPSILLSGPAGANKTALARRLLRDNPGLAVAADFQSIYRALSLVTRGPDGRFPLRDERLLPLVEYVRRAIITGAKNAQIDVIATNSDGDPPRRQFLLQQLGDGSSERVIAPGRAVVEARLADPETGELAEACNQAIGRWYDRF